MGITNTLAVEVAERDVRAFAVQMFTRLVNGEGPYAAADGATGDIAAALAMVDDLSGPIAAQDAQAVRDTVMHFMSLVLRGAPLEVLTELGQPASIRFVEELAIELGADPDKLGKPGA